MPSRPRTVPNQSRWSVETLGKKAPAPGKMTVEVRPISAPVRFEADQPSAHLPIVAGLSANESTLMLRIKSAGCSTGCNGAGKIRTGCRCKRNEAAARIIPRPAAVYAHVRARPILEIGRNGCGPSLQRHVGSRSRDCPEGNNGNCKSKSFHGKFLLTPVSGPRLSSLCRENL
jgi:hypothetical protein